MTVHIYEDGQYHSYCEVCERRIDDQKKCRNCSTSFTGYMASGFLGCGECYKTHQADLLSVLPRYFNRSPVLWPDPVRGPKAESRTKTILELFEPQNIQKHRKREIQPGQSQTKIWQQILENLNKRSLIRLRVARNFQMIPYLHLLSEQARSILSSALTGPGSSPVQLISRALKSEPAELDRSMLTEAKARDLLSASVTGATVWNSSSGGSVWLYTGDEDHLRLQWLVAAPEALSVAPQMNSVIRALDEGMDWQYHRTFGYLTACPSNAGSGCRLSCSTNLEADPSFFRTWRRALKPAGIELRGPADESPVQGPVILTYRNDGRALEIVERIRTLIRLKNRMEAKIRKNRITVSSDG